MTIIDNQRGNIFFYILLAIALFAALSYAVATSMRGNTGVSNERQKLIASEIIDAGSRLAEAVTRMRLHGVMKNQISFENLIYDVALDNYDNVNCAIDSCKVFTSDGGGLSWETPPPEITSRWGYTGALDISGTGPTTTAELVALLPGLSAELCLEINVMLGLHARTVAVPSGFSFANLTRYPGSFVTAATLTNTILSGKKSGCFEASSIDGTAIDGAPLTDSYVYYQVLLVN